MKRLPIGIGDFANLITGDNVYVDKTKLIHQLINTAPYNFLSRPRRFGKTLLITTLAELFRGRRELFADTWIYDQWDWKPYSVIEFSFARLDYQSQSLEHVLSNYLRHLAANHRIELQSNYPRDQFAELILGLGKKAPVVILVDEYDKPIIDYLDNTAIAIANRNYLKNFYGLLKDTEIAKYIQFVLITGVTKFSQVSFFSELNNLRDISIHPTYATLTGITEAEITTYFEPWLATVARQLGQPMDELRTQMRVMYNGYSWDGEHFVYNPFSLIRFLDTQTFGLYWFSTGTPSFLVRQIYDQQLDIRRWENMQVGYEFFDKFSIDKIDITALLFQSGYLTIKSLDRQALDTVFTLGYPNQEVERGLLINLLETYAEQPDSEAFSLVRDFRELLFKEDIEGFVQLFKRLFADISNRLLQQYIKSGQDHLWEAYYQTVIYLVLKLIGINIQVEVQTNRGFVDAVIIMPNAVYLIEFKMGSAEEALQQIRSSGYAEGYLHRDRPVILLGIAFDPEARNIKDYQVEKITN